MELSRPLSIFENGKPPAVVVASLLLFTSRIHELRNGTEITFETFQGDAAPLKPLIGKTIVISLTKGPIFWAAQVA
jgi:hypothetical protein